MGVIRQPIPHTKADLWLTMSTQPLLDQNPLSHRDPVKKVYIYLGLLSIDGPLTPIRDSHLCAASSSYYTSMNPSSLKTVSKCYQLSLFLSCLIQTGQSKVSPDVTMATESYLYVVLYKLCLYNYLIPLINLQSNSIHCPWPGDLSLPLSNWKMLR